MKLVDMSMRNFLPGSIHLCVISEFTEWISHEIMLLQSMGGDCMNSQNALSNMRLAVRGDISGNSTFGS